MSSLKDKITTLEALQVAMQNLGLDYRAYESLVKQSYFSTLSNLPIPFWAVREQVRINHKLYGITDALESINRHIACFAHISTEDRTLVAFTPDRNSGEADRQVRTTIGRLISKVLPFADDKYIQALIAEHNSELTNEIEFITGEDIAKTYAAGFNKVGACMSGKSFDVQPTLIYDAPGIKMAVRRDADGEIIERAMVYENGDDKRYIRMYPGSGSALVRRLQRAGFKVGNWCGVQFRTIFHPIDGEAGETRSVVVPYLDANGGHATLIGSSVALFDDKLTAVTQTQYEAIKRRYPMGHERYMQIPGTSGYVTLRPLKSTDFTVVDSLTGETVCLLKDDRTARSVYRDGVIITTYSEDVSNYQTAFTRSAIGSTVEVYIVQDTPTFREGWRTWVDNATNRAGCGQYQLDESVYPEDRGWYTRYNTTTIEIDGVAKRVKLEDCVWLVTTEGGEKKVFAKEITKKHTKLHRVTGKLPGYAEPGAKVYKTSTNRKVHPAYNDNIYVYWDGTADFSRGRSSVYVDDFGKSVRAKDAQHLRAYYASDEYIKLKQGYLSGFPDIYAKLASLERSTHYNYYMCSGAAKVRWTGTTRGSSLFKLSVIQRLASEAKLSFAEAVFDIVSNIRNVDVYSYNCNFEAAERTLVESIGLELADALAEEAPTYLAAPAPVPEVVQDLPQPEMTIENAA